MWEPTFVSIMDPDDPVLLPPGAVPARIAAAGRASGQPERPPAAVVRTILESFTVAHAASLRTAARLAGCDVEVVPLVGGGARNASLCQLTAWYEPRGDRAARRPAARRAGRAG
ncbi:FGGY-family carbohydrate kinase [Amycolatopsis arida]|nr:FGGY-family carbohydrate kinase [Amycolatopsis arida]